MDEFNVRTHKDEKVTSNSVILQDMPVSVLDSAGFFDQTKVKLVTSHLKEGKNRLDPDNATIIVLLPIAN